MKKINPKGTLGLAGKLLIGFSISALLPLAVALFATIRVYSSQINYVGSITLEEKSRSVNLLLAARAQNIALLTANAAQDNVLIINAELGLQQSVTSYLSRIRQSSGVDAIGVEKPDGALFAYSGNYLKLDTVQNLNGMPFGIVNFKDDFMVVSSFPLNVKSWDQPGKIICQISLANLAQGLADSLETEIIAFSGKDKAISLDTKAGAASLTGFLPLDKIVLSDKELVKVLPQKNFSKAFAANRFPLGVKDSPIWIGIALELKELDASLLTGFFILALTAVIAISLSIITSVFFSHRIAKPALQLAEVARRISSGAYGQTTGLKLQDEIGYLAREFDEMSLTLASQEEARQIAEEALRMSEAKFRAIFDGVTEAVFIHDPIDGHILDFNRASIQMYGLEGLRPGDFTVEDISEKDAKYTNEIAFALIQETAFKGEKKTEWKGKRLNEDKVFWLEVFFNKAFVGGKNTVIVTCRNIEDRKAAENSMKNSIKEREALIQEVHHRVKNNFQIINSLVNLQSDTIVDKIATAALQDTKSRIHAMALVHERLYQSENLSSIDLGSYLQELAQDVNSAYAPTGKKRITLKTDVQSIWTKADLAIPCGLILNELMTNSMKHAFGTNDGEIGMALSKEGDQLTLMIWDNGKGFADGKKPEIGSSLGMSLIDALVKQLNGSIQFFSDQGAKVMVQFPLGGLKHAKTTED